MEVNKNRSSVGVHKSEKKKLQLNLLGGGGGLVLLGGGMAVAALVAAFTVIKNKHHTTRGHKNEEPTSITPDDDDNVQKRDAIASPGLSFVLQTPTTTVTQNSCCTSHETSTIAVTVSYIDSCELVSTHNLVSEDKSVPIIIADGIENPVTSNQKILASDDSSEESITSSYDIIAAEEFTLPAPEGVPLDEPENLIENDSVESFEFMETDQVKKEDDAMDAEVLAGEENLPMRLVEEDDDDDGVYVENVTEKEEESPEGKFAVEEYSAMQEILLSDDSDQESIALGNDMLCADNSALAVPDDSFLDIEPENMVNNNSGENVQFTETIEVIKKGEAVNTDKLVVEENSPKQSIEEDQEDSSCEEQVIDKEEESPEGKLAVEENLLMQSVKKEAEDETEEATEEETENDSSEEHASEIGDEGSQGKLAEEDNSVTQSVEEEEDESEDDDDDDGDDSSEEVTEDEEDSSEGTGSSSMDSNVEAIWPAEMMDTPPLELKELNVNHQNSGDKIADEDRMVKTGNHDLVDCKSVGKTVYNERGGNSETTENSRMMLNKKAAQELVTMKDQTAHSPRGRIWIWSMMVLVFMLLLLHIFRTAIPHDLPYHDSVIVA